MFKGSAMLRAATDPVEDRSLHVWRLRRAGVRVGVEQVVQHTTVTRAVFSRRSARPVRLGGGGRDIPEFRGTEIPARIMDDLGE